MRKVVSGIGGTALERGVDSLIRAVAPQMALRRMEARAAIEKRSNFAYRAARPSIDRETAPRSLNPDGPITQRDRISLMFEARDLTENVGFVKSYQRKLQTYVAGSLVYEPDTGSDAADEQIRQYVIERSKDLHDGGQYTLARIMQLAIMGMARDGDSLLTWVKRDRLRLRIVEADQIGELTTFMNRPDYSGGVILNDVGGIWGYRIYDRVSDLQYANPQEVEAYNCVYLADPMRPGVRSVTAYDTSITNIRDKFEMLGFEKIVVKELSTTGVVTYTQRPGMADEDADMYEESDGKGGLSFIRRMGGVVREYMGVGEKFEVVSNNRPSPTFNGFIKTLDEEDCQGINLPYGFQIDPTAAGGAALRMIAHMASREFERLQNDILTPALERIRDVILMEGVALGEIEWHPNMLRGVWMFPPPPTADVQRESDITIRELQAGLITWTEAYAIYRQNRSRQWKVRKQEIKDRYRLAAEATAELKAEGIDVLVSPDEIASLSSNPQFVIQPAVDTATSGNGETHNPIPGA